MDNLCGERDRDFSEFPDKYNGGKEVVGPFGPVGSTPFVSMEVRSNEERRTAGA